MATAVGEHDILTAVEIPVKAAGQGSAYVKFEHPASRYAVIGVAALVTVVNGTCTAAAVALCGLVPRPVRASSVEKALVGKPPISRGASPPRPGASAPISAATSSATSMPRRSTAPAWRRSTSSAR